MKRRLGFWALVFFATGVVGLVLKTNSEQNAVQLQNANINQPQISEAQNASGLVMVARVLDGDTIEITGGEKVRYIGMNTPETVDPRKPVQCFGKAASARNKELVDGKLVRLEKDTTDRDKYGRLLRYVFLPNASGTGETFVNLALIEDGYAHVDTFPPDVKYQNEFVAAESAARAAKRGLWGKCL